MKRIIPPFLLALVVALAFSSCAGPIESFTFTSPDGDRSIEIKGERAIAGDPVTVHMTLNVPGGTKSFSFEHQASSLTKENVSADWINNYRCTVTFTLDDGDIWEVETFLMDDKVQAIKKFKLDGRTIFD